MKNAIIWLQLILQERFGHQFTINYKDNGYRLKLLGSDRGSIYFPTKNELFVESHSNGPCTLWDAEAEGWESVLGGSIPAPNEVTLPTPLIQSGEEEYIIHYDILGLTYWMLNRIEEIGRGDLDNHQRFPAVNSHAYKHNYLERPIVDEWLHILGQVIQRVWPNIELTQHQFSMKVSHDVDKPSRYGFRDFKGLIRTIGGDIIKEKRLSSIWEAPKIWLATRKELHPRDPYNTFEWIMDTSDSVGLTSSFYFICGGKHKNDADYDIDHPTIRALLRRIKERGHKIGLHPSYETYRNPQKLKDEANNLKRICLEEGIEQEMWGGRMHYLRWEHPTTLQAWADAGLDYDSTLSYADRAGFRCGTCFEYPAYNSENNKILNLRIRPLIAMEASVIDQRHMGLGYSEKSYQKFYLLKERCEKLRGSFTMLWHNSHFDSQKDFELYMALIS